MTCRRSNSVEQERDESYTVHHLWTDRDVVALVRVASVKKRKQEVWVDPVEVYKGELRGRTRIDVFQSWMPPTWFVKGETALVFVLQHEDGTYSAPGYTGRMALTSVGDEQVLDSWYFDAEFWEGFDPVFEHVRARVSWPKLRRFLLRLKRPASGRTLPAVTSGFV